MEQFFATLRGENITVDLKQRPDWWGEIRARKA
jgi:hypothetical protein